MSLLGVQGAGWRLPLVLGGSSVELDCFENQGRPYPDDANASDICFQHLALVTDDAKAAWSCAAGAGAREISHPGPVTLPASAGGVTAIKFRDIDGHPLEFLQFASGAKTAWHGKGILGIDHSAISVANPDLSQRFYRARGLCQEDPTFNHGPTQIALDGLAGVQVDVIPLKPIGAPPHVELLGYRHPLGRTSGPLATNDVASTRIVWHSDQNRLLRDPDGHIHQFSRD